MNPLIVVVVNVSMNGLDELSDVVEPFDVSEFEFEVAVKRFLQSILPRAALAAVGRSCAITGKQRFVCSGYILASLIGMEIR